VITPVDLCLEALPSAAPAVPIAQPLSQSQSEPVTSSAALGDDLQQREFEIIFDMLRDTKGSRKTAAERLGISPRTLRYKLARMRDVGFNLDGVVSGI